mmetsp:Transcript_13791/g.37373  ORF Transcript_13791/g.37373 Transcript_13791/m.37373 type:complete len:267 (-) Transcript_13791:59-859(-)
MKVAFHAQNGVRGDLCDLRAEQDGLGPCKVRVRSDLGLQVPGHDFLDQSRVDDVLRDQVRKLIPVSAEVVGDEEGHGVHARLNFHAFRGIVGRPSRRIQSRGGLHYVVVLLRAQDLAPEAQPPAIWGRLLELSGQVPHGASNRIGLSLREACAGPSDHLRVLHKVGNGAHLYGGVLLIARCLVQGFDFLGVLGAGIVLLLCGRWRDQLRAAGLLHKAAEHLDETIGVLRPLCDHPVNHLAEVVVDLFDPLGLRTGHGGGSAKGLRR